MFVAKQNNSSKPSSSPASKSNSFIQPKLKVVKSEDKQEATKNKKQEKNKKTQEASKFFAAKTQTKGLDTVTNPKKKQKEEGKENSKEKESGEELVVKEVSTKQVTIENSSDENTIKEGAKGKGKKGLVEVKNKEEKQKPAGEKEKGSLGKKVAEKTTPRNPKEDPNFKKLEGKLKKTSKEQQQHENSKASASVAQSAAVSPENERVSMAQSGQVEAMAEAESGTFNAVDFKAKLMERIEGMQLPKNQDEAANFDENNNIDEVNQSATQDVESEKTAAAGPVEQTSKQEPNVGAIPQREVTPLPAAPIGNKPVTANPKKAMPPKRGNAEVNKPLEDNIAEVDQQMATNKVTDEQLEKSNEPSFTQGLDAKNEAEKDASTSPVQLRQKEKGVLQNAKSGAAGKEQSGLAEMHQDRSKLLNQVTGSQTKTGGKDTSERTRIATEINKIYENSKTAVEKILTDLDIKVKAVFKAGTALAKMKFESHVASKMSAYKARRYSGVSGKLKWVKDKFAGMPDEVNDFFVTGRKEYIDTMDKVITKVAEYVATKLTEAKTRVTTGKQEVQEYVTSLPQNLQKLGKEAAEEINDKFDELEDSVNSKQDELVDSLAEQYMEGLNAVDARIEEMKAANRGLIDAALGFINGIIETIKKLRDLIATLLAEIQNAMDVIMEDPIGFVATLFEGVGKGIDMFMANIQKHMLGGFVTWLTGAMGPVGITIPDNLFSLKGIFNLVMQVLGLSWSFVRKKSVLLMGEPMVAAMEKGFEMFQIIREKGVSGIWEYIKEQFTDLKETIIESIKSMLITQVIEAGIKWLLSLLIPGAGFIKAIMAIKDLIVFFVQSAIMLIPSLIQAIKSLASGNVAGVAKAIEKGLAMLLPLVISLFAKLIGLGGLVKKVQKIIKKVRKRIDRAVTKMIKKAKKKFKSLVKKGKAKVKGAVKGLLQWWKKKKKFKLKSGEKHDLYFKKKSKNPQLIMASKNPSPLVDKINGYLALTGAKKSQVVKNTGELNKAKAEANKMYEEIRRLEARSGNKKTNDSKDIIEAFLNKIKNHLIKGLNGENDLPLSNVTYSKSKGRPNKVLANPLTKNEGNTKGANSSDRTILDGYNLIDTWVVKSGKKRNVSNALGVHILAHHLHGPWTSWNAVFGSRSLNENMKGPEKIANTNSKTSALEFNTKVLYFSNTKKDSKITKDSSIEDVKEALSFYIAEHIEVKIMKLDGSKKTSLFNNKVKGILPDIVGEPQKTVEEKVIELLNSKKANPLEKIIDGSTEYHKTIFTSKTTIAKAITTDVNKVSSVVDKLITIDKVRRKPKRGAFYIKK
ncbi:hypothetical protein [Tenacibaculum ovolyticum]|uniref:hypothetical protein n=1 Tax=Tenacibaculum ovolyticum TaxID=104270 RepID=UPI0007ED0170|nr:hypothetical protein [Tenacibaculum ovolyticum]